jgi:uncharacterized membrane protein
MLESEDSFFLTMMTNRSYYQQRKYIFAVVIACIISTYFEVLHCMAGGTSLSGKAHWSNADWLMLSWISSSKTGGTIFKGITIQ